MITVSFTIVAVLSVLALVLYLLRRHGYTLEGPDGRRKKVPPPPPSAEEAVARLAGEGLGKPTDVISGPDFCELEYTVANPNKLLLQAAANLGVPAEYDRGYFYRHGEARVTVSFRRKLAPQQHQAVNVAKRKTFYIAVSKC